MHVHRERAHSYRGLCSSPMILSEDVDQLIRSFVCCIFELAALTLADQQIHHDIISLRCTYIERGHWYKGLGSSPMILSKTWIS